MKLDPKFLATLARLQAEAAARREAAAKEAASVSLVIGEVQPESTQEKLSRHHIQFNDQQRSFIDQAIAMVKNPRKDKRNILILIGAAGTGKTTAVGGLLQALLEEVAMPEIAWNHKHLPVTSRGMIFCAFTRRATDNIRKRLPADFSRNCITIHKTLEYEPVWSETLDPKTQRMRNTMRFEPKRGHANPLPADMQVLLIDEFSMLGSILWGNLKKALPPHVVVIFVGDLYQLAPVMDTPAIADYLCKEGIPTIELTEVYRQALDNPIIKYATDIRRGKTFSVPAMTELVSPDGKGKLTLRPWKAATSESMAIKQLGMFFAQELASGNYDPREDMILIPYNKGVGTIELNKYIGSALAQMHNRTVFQVLAGFNQHYFSVGDFCIYDKMDCEVLEIKRNWEYMGKMPLPESTLLDYWGHTPDMKRTTAADIDDDEVDRMLSAAMAADVKDGERVTAASHKIKVRLTETGEELELVSASDINKLVLSYLTTIHKAQGSEARKVYLCLHRSHTMVKRETLYTGFTRAREELYVLCEKDSFITGVARQEIKGETLQEKARALRVRAALNSRNGKGEEE